MAVVCLNFSTLDLTRTRFAFSPLWEAVMSFRARRDPARFAIHLPWLRESSEALSTLDLRPLEALVRPHGYIPDFLTPPPLTPLPDITAELAVLRATDAALVQREVRRTWADGTDLPPGARRYLTHPDAALAELADTLQAYWDRALAAHWPRLRAMLEHDLLTRARRLALHGPEGVFRDLSPLLHFNDGVLELHDSLCCHAGRLLDLSGRGLLLMPSAFVWPAFSTILDPAWQPTLAYTPRGVATLWDDTPPQAGAALPLLLGRGRAEVLLSVRTPSSTLDLARRLHLAPSSVSEHLSVLRQGGLVEAHRQGRIVAYGLTPTGGQLLELLGAVTPEQQALLAL